MKQIIITICLLIAAGCSLPKSPEYQGVHFPSLAQMQGRSEVTRESILKGLRILMNDPAAYRRTEILLQNIERKSNRNEGEINE